MEKIKIDLLPNNFIKEDGTFNKEKAIAYCGKIAGICYSTDGYKDLENEDDDISTKRANFILKRGHHSVFDHVWISLNIQNMPKLLAMVINNEKQYTTSEKSARYTEIIAKEDSAISREEISLYNKWKGILNNKIKETYGDVFDDEKISKLANENARYMITVFMPTHLIYSTSLRQINNLIAYMQDYIKSYNDGNKLHPVITKLIPYMQDFIKELEDKNLSIPKLQMNEKHNKLTLFADKKAYEVEYFKGTYSTNYYVTWAELAQAQRHRTLHYEIKFLKARKYFVPPIIETDDILKEMWLNDITSVCGNYPQGELVYVRESGHYEDFIRKAKERMCSLAQLEIAAQTKKTMDKYIKSLIEDNNPLAQDARRYSKGARCTFPDYDCLKDCKFKEGKTFRRKI